MRQSITNRRRLGIWSGLGLAAVLTVGCGQENPPPIQTSPTSPAASAASAGQTPKPSPAETTPPKPEAVPVAAGESAPQTSNSSRVPKITAIERWDNAKLGGGEILLRPESIAEDPQTGDLYVSNVNGNPRDKDGNGYTTQLKWMDGKLSVAAAKRFPPAGGKLNGPKGTLVVGDLLWLVDIDVVKAFDLRGKEGHQLKSFSIPEAEFGNDLVVTAEGTVFVTDTGKNSIYMIQDDNVGAGLRKFVTTQATGANGIVWNAKTGQLVVAQTDFSGGQMGLLTVDISGIKEGDAKLTPLTDKFGKLDGLVALPSGALLVSDWNARAIWWVAADGKTREKVVEGFMGAADFCLCKDGKTLAIPDMPRNEVVIVRFEKPLE